MAISVAVKGNIEKAIRTFKKQVEKDGVLRELRIRQYHAKPSVRRKRKQLRAQKRRAKARRH